MLHVDTSTGNWTELDPRFRKMMAMWKKDRDIAAFLDKTSRGDCRTCLEELKSHWKDHPEPTGDWEDREKALCMSHGDSGSGRNEEESVCHRYQNTSMQA